MTSKQWLHDLGEQAERTLRAVGRGTLTALEIISQAIEKHQNSPAPCAGCRQEFLRKDMHWLHDIPAYADKWYMKFCDTCRTRLRHEYEYEGILRDERRKVIAQRNRAMAKGLPATLTFDEWLDTLEYYECRCAYCRVAPYEAIEHVVPIERGGGTTVGNCVPACKSCNSAKGVRLPGEIRESSRSPAAMARVQQYLESKRDRTPQAFT